MCETVCNHGIKEEAISNDADYKGTGKNTLAPYTLR